MNNDRTAPAELWPLIDAALDGSITAQQASELQSLLETDLEACRVYGEVARVEAELHLLIRGRAANEAVRQRAMSDDQALAPRPPSFIPDDSAPFASSFSPVSSFVGYLSQGWPLAYLVAIAVLSIGLLIGAMMPVSRSVQMAEHTAPLTPSVVKRPMNLAGQITGMVDCQWADVATATVGCAVPLGRKYALRSGLLEISYDTGAKVILQGPATYEVESISGGFLSLGKLTAKLQKSGERREERGEGTPNLQISKSPSSSLSMIPSPLFTIKTPTATVTDLGTEFGVEVDKEGRTTSHVFRGVVRVQMVAVDGNTQGAAQVLRENESVRVDASQGQRRIVVVPAATSASFVRDIPKRTIKVFDLVDVVAGGDGFSGRRNRGIDPTSGRIIDLPPEEPAKRPVGDGKYHRVEAIPFVDGVFVPDSRRGPVQVDSAGHTFAEFGTSENRVFRCYIWAGGGKLPARVPQLRTEFDGIDYLSSGHGLLLMHASKGITFDLEAIRRANPGSKLLRFRATARNAEKASEKGEAVYADIWVLVDGKVRFRRWQINGYNGAFPVVVPLGESDRFLTLATTDGGNGIWSDWIMFGDPRLELVSGKPNSVQEAGAH